MMVGIRKLLRATLYVLLPKNRMANPQYSAVNPTHPHSPFPKPPSPDPHSPTPPHTTPKTPLSPSPNLLIASCTCSAPAAANVIRKNISSPPSASARNQLPLLDNTPLSIPAWKISSSMSSIDVVSARGCRCHSIRIQ